MSEAVHAEHAEHGEHEPVEAEIDRPRNWLIAIYIIGMCVLIVATVIGVYELFVVEFKAEIQSKVLDPQNSVLRELRASEEAKLTRYQWVSQKDGVVRMPLPRAIELTLKDYREAALRPPEPPPPAPTDTATAPVEGEEKKAEDAKAEEGKKAEDAKAEEAKKAEEEAKKAADAEKKAADAEKKKKAPAPAKKPAPAPAAPAPAPDVY